MRASQLGILPLIQFLLHDKQTDINAKGPKGKTALHYAARHPERAIFFAFLNMQRTDTSVTNDKKQTARQYAASKRLEPIDIRKVFELRKMWVQSYLSLKKAKCSPDCENCLHRKQLPAEVCLKIVGLLTEKSLPAKSKNIL